MTGKDTLDTKPENAGNELSSDTGVDPESKSDAAKVPQSDGRHAVLFVDDEPPMLMALARAFRLEEFDAITAESADEALEVLESRSVSVVISDYRMPGTNGVELLEMVNIRYPKIIRILLTGAASAEPVVKAINDGSLYKCVPKPWEDDALRQIIKVAIARFEST